MNKLHGMMVYLSGPMDRAPDGGVEWRKKITPELHKLGMGVLDPCSKPTREFGTEEGAKTRATVQELITKNEFAEAHKIVKKIIAYDLRMVDIASVIIAYVDSDIHMCGTYDEIFFAKQQNKPILIVCTKGYSAIPNWLYGRLDYKLFFTSFEDALAYLAGINNGEIQADEDKWRFFDFEQIFNICDFTIS